ncbi:Dual specificity protein kinase KNS1 [Wickerhamomyces ciferrii]|uniref:Dual specificity protein kinase KNS1 n=1 Tax=Wickerhamomyces ciferrii (strain ATCC 14091 / BCRC 22168 / CBS 111 / JCM 3599 / NBRC 0793 / NRRL Y-1031 F-60-10) TaxID=1206466 RepID=K0KMQ3_WICCF|nr:Dual specificity protein kinase KNS1 [Wickerhamomyces ciferrii]CCH46560.1 Dual specificity protein kinase KNS1 [Wickerhamomyces ciferrii]
MSLIDSRKRPRSSFSDWNNLIKKKFINEDQNNQDQDLNDLIDKDNSSIVILDSDDENYEFNDKSNEGDENNNNNNDDNESIVILKEEQNNYQDPNFQSNFQFGDFNNYQGFQQGFQYNDMAIDDDLDLNSTTNEDDGQLLANLLKNENLNGNNGNHSHQGSLNNPHEGIQVGVKKRRTNSLPQLPLSQISYRRVSELIKIGEIKPNLILSNNNSEILPINIPSSSNTTGNFSSSSSSNSFQSNNNIHYQSSNTTSPLSPISKNSKPKNITDKDGYYIVKPGEFFANGRFKILSLLGQGTFGKVIKAIDFQNNNETVAIKIIRAIPKYREASKIELRILTTLKNADPENLNNCIHLREVLDYENHICIITDLLDISLFEFLEQNKFKPFPGSQIQAIARQLIRSIAFLHDLKLIHTDLKPENILLTNSDFLKFKKNKILKNPLINVIDFGSAIFNDEYHSELVSTRHYRAPEIVLGIGWSFPCDLWSLGCILMELVTGEALFKTHENLEHLAIMEKILDERIPNSIIKKIKNQEILKYFKKTNYSNHQSILNYPNQETLSKSIDFVSNLKKIDDLICSKIKLKISINSKESLKKNWEKNHSKNKSLNYETFQFWFYFIDLIKNLLKFDPNQRISAIEAMNHPWWDFGTIDEATSSLL